MASSGVLSNEETLRFLRRLQHHWVTGSTRRRSIREPGLSSTHDTEESNRLREQFSANNVINIALSGTSTVSRLHLLSERLLPKTLRTLEEVRCSDLFADALFYHLPYSPRISEIFIAWSFTRNAHSLAGLARTEP